ncbi:MAG: AAA family ATPase, partial [Rhodobacteraceae bacterium]|nr:AAA family ATPase [Paracoccaceae bacterium]
MLARLYADNFLCMVNFELFLDETNILLGPSGSGKTSVLRALGVIQSLVSSGSTLNEILTFKDLTEFEDRNIQRFEIDLILGKDAFRYTLR